MKLNIKFDVKDVLPKNIVEKTVIEKKSNKQTILEKIEKRNQKVQVKEKVEATKEAKQ